MPHVQKPRLPRNLSTHRLIEDLRQPLMIAADEHREEKYASMIWRELAQELVWTEQEDMAIAKKHRQEANRLLIECRQRRCRIGVVVELLIRRYSLSDQQKERLLCPKPYPQKSSKKRKRKK